MRPYIVFNGNFFASLLELGGLEQLSIEVLEPLRRVANKEGIMALERY